MTTMEPGRRRLRFAGTAGILSAALLLQGCLAPEQKADGEENNINTVADTESAEGDGSGNGNAAPDTALKLQDGIVGAVEEASAAVVGVTNLQTAGNYWTGSEETVPAGVGSGVIYKKEGGKAYVVTNNHVVEGASQIEITLEDGTKVAARLLGADIWTDLAVVEMEDAAVQDVIEFGDSDKLKRGQTAIAIGNPLGLGFSGSVTVGVISGKERSIPVDLNGDQSVDWNAEVLQTDAAINPGNSGGALVDLNGQLIGINSMKIAEASVEGIGLAIPINSAVPIIEDLEQHGEVRRPQMGVTLFDLMDIPAVYQQQELNLPEDVTEGVVVDQVMQGSPAQEAGLRQYDVITAMDGERIANLIDLRKYLYNEVKQGDTVELEVYRGGEAKDIEINF
ncbi:serine protease Do [Bhargavaea ginsengi]|uniref:Serine protease Do n=1 Tax=Bhargavaea ginsengi TaxID=426757 RepID=A0A1H6ZQQ5_9BACL|nr:trypsin-like peptidase domain-containing protein [Bhargavaea ginsengi]MCM3087591.1 trypsin-like peptidase domain-containing protein [Bhargavaea ginsengi]SEJ55691.1 serine protease Do [Bhargavaea ginsengi]